MSGLRASSKGGNSQRVDNVELIPAGFQLCTLYGIIQLGTQPAKGDYSPSDKVRLAFEFQDHYRVFFEGNDAQPASIFVTETLSMHEKANLRKKYVQPMSGNSMTDDEADKFDISSLLGQSFVANISHSPDGKWANIESITPLTEQNRQMFPNDPSQVNKTQFFTTEQGYESENFAMLSNSVREKIMNSAEGKEYALSGGNFAEKMKNETTTAAASSPQGPPSSGGNLVMIDKTFTYEEMIKSGWTDELLIANGKAKINQPAPPPAPITSAATPPPPPVKAATPPPPVKEPVLVMINPDDIAKEWIDAGWTEEQIIAGGHGKLI